MTTENNKRGRANESSSSVIAAEIMHIPPAEIVGSSDLLTEILFRLPARLLLRFKTISKHWYFLIASPKFRLKHLSNPNPVLPLGLFVPLAPKKEVQSNHIVCDFVPFDIEFPVKAPFRVLRFDLDVEKIDIEHSSNGLMLCHSQSTDLTQPNRHVISNKYYAYNPTINQFTMLPKPEYYDKSNRLGMTIAFDPSKSPHYKIVYVSGGGTCSNGKTNYLIEIYSSETNICKSVYPFSLIEEVDSFKMLIGHPCTRTKIQGGSTDTRFIKPGIMNYPDIKTHDIYFGGGVYWNNAVHWHHYTGIVLYFKLDEEVIDYMSTPSRLLDESHEDYSGYMFESRGHLLVVEIPRVPDNVEFEIHELKEDYSEWIMKYRVNLDGVSRSFPEIISTKGRIKFTLLSLVLGEKDDDSFLVLEIPGKAIRFNIISWTCHKLLDFTGDPSSVRSIKFDREYVHKPNVFQFVESLYSV